MKIRSLSIFAVLIILLTACDSLKPKFKEFVSTDGGFSIEVPGDPKAETKTVNLGDTKIDFKMYSVEAGSEAFAFSFNDYNFENPEQVNAKDVLDGARTGGLKNMAATLTSESDIRIDGFPGREINASSSEFDVRIRLYLVKNRLYQIMHLSKKGTGDPERIRHYMDSFKLRR